MIIPIRCHTCNKVLADIWRFYKEENLKLEKEEKKKESNKIHEDIKYKYLQNQEEIMNKRNKLMNDLNITKICCRRILLTHVDIFDFM